MGTGHARTMLTAIFLDLPVGRLTLNNFLSFFITFLQTETAHLFFFEVGRWGYSPG